MNLWERSTSHPTVMPHIMRVQQMQFQATSTLPQQTSHSSAEVAKSCANLNGICFVFAVPVYEYCTLIRPIAEILNAWC